MICDLCHKPGTPFNRNYAEGVISIELRAFGRRINDPRPVLTLFGSEALVFTVIKIQRREPHGKRIVFLKKLLGELSSFASMY